MATAIFVHGTGVREPHYATTYNLIKSKLVALKLTAMPEGIDVGWCYWGEEFGTKLHAGGASIPEYMTARDVSGMTEEDYELALWALLYDDPLYELRLLALGTSVDGERPPGAVPSDELLQRARALTPGPELQKKLGEAGVAAVFAAARDEVVDSDACLEALGAAPEALGEYRAAIARAIVAECEIRRGEEARLAVSMDGPLRDEIVQLLVEALGGVDRSAAFEWLRDHVRAVIRKTGERALKTGAHVSGFLARRYRRTVTDSAYAAAGDVLLYQGSGDGIRAWIRKAILGAAESAPPVMVLGHSLGGIAAVDLLIKEALPVRLLVTVGSQAPILYELNALQSLRWGQPLPPHFPPWLNIWDPRDLLSYVGSKVFKKEVRDYKVEDFEVDNGQPFIECHSSYWHNDRMWQKIAEAIEVHLR